MPSKHHWIPCKRNYKEEQKKIHLAHAFTPCSQNHPLQQQQQQQQPLSSTTSATSPKSATGDAISPSSKGESQFDDPLSKLLGSVGHAAVDSGGGDEDHDGNVHDDPLRREDKKKKGEEKEKTIVLSAQLNRSSASRQTSTFLNWNAKKAGYLKRYTTDKNIPVVSSIVDDEGEDGNGSVITLEDRLKMRMDQLEGDKDEENVQFKTQKDFIKHLEELNEELKSCFDSDRVRAFKIVVRCCKMIGQNKVPPFFPSMFVLVSEVLDSFGMLVAKRIRHLATVRNANGRITFKLPPVFSCVDVSEDAKEVCRNWFYKIASIRELDARIYTEMAIVGCRKFLTDDRNEIRDHVERMGKTIRGLSDPLVAAFARLYLARKGIELLPHERKYQQQLLDDTFYTIERQCSGDPFDKHLAHHKMTKGEYMELFEPPLEWMFETLGSDAGEEMFRTSLQNYERSARFPVVLKSIIVGFDAEYISRFANVLVFYIKESDDGSIPQHQLYRALGEKFLRYPPSDQDKLKLLNEIWKDVTQIDNIRHYTQLVEIYIEFVGKSFSLREVAILLRDLHKHLKPYGISESHIVEDELKNILMTVMEYADDFVDAFNLEPFLPIFDRLSPRTQVEVSKSMLTAFSRRDKTIGADPIIMNSLLDLAKTVHDSVNDLTPEQERHQIGMLLSKFVSKINFGMAFEKQLAFCVDVRRAFSSFDIVKEAVVSAVLTMINQTFTVVKGKHNRKTLNFVKAALAFCHITIPSIDDIFSRLNYFVLSGQVAVVNNLLGQADSLFRIAIETIADVPQLFIREDGTMVQTEKDLLIFIRYLISSMVAVPGHPEHGPFYLFKGLVKVIMDYQWSVGSTARVEIMIDMLKSLTAFSQGELPYHYRGASASNDELFVGDESYQQDIITIGNRILEEIMKQMAELSKDEDVNTKRKQSLCALELFSVIAFQTELRRDMLVLAYNLFHLAMKQQSSPAVHVLIKSSLRHLKQKAELELSCNPGMPSPSQQLFERLSEITQ